MKNLRPTPGESRYAEFDEETGYWSVFGSNSGFCYSQHGSKEEAERAADGNP